MARIIFMPKRKTLLRLTVSFVILVLSIVSLTIFLLYSSTSDQISKQLLRRVRDASMIAARLAERSEVPWENVGLEKSRRFKTLFSQLYDLSEAMGLENIYIIDRQMNCYLIVKGPPIKTAEEYVRIVKDPFDRAFRGELILSGIYPKKSNQYVSAYAPIFNPKGKVAFLVGADLDVSGLKILAQVRDNALIVLGVTVLASLLMSMILSYTIVTPIKNMVVAAEQIGLGNFEIEVPVSGRDELGFLGQTMNDMVRDIRRRDHTISELTKGIIDDLRIYNELILEGMINGVMTFNLEGRIESINPAAKHILASSSRELVGRDFRSLPVLAGPLLDKVLEAIKLDRPFNNFEARLPREGADVLVRCDFAPLNDRDSNTIGHMLFLGDVTEIRKLESQVKLKEKMAAIGELSAGIAHEIRNPLNSIELFLGLLQRKPKGQEEQINLVHKVRQEIQKLNVILSDFLKFARPMRLDLTETDLRRVITDSIFFTQAEIDARQITLILDVEDDPMVGTVDSQQVQQAFSNLILNAAQAMKKRGRLIIHATNGQPGYWSISFTDNGPGIPSENLSLVFNPFFTTKDEGTGLGLAMVHKIIETHGGSIDLVSSKKGTTFTINLPRTG